MYFEVLLLCLFTFHSSYLISTQYLEVLKTMYSNVHIIYNFVNFLKKSHNLLLLITVASRRVMQNLSEL